LLGRWNWWPGHFVITPSVIQPEMLAEAMPIVPGTEQPEGSHS
jgi:hypothetical protein